MPRSALARICLAIASTFVIASCGGQTTLPSSAQDQDATEEPNACGGASVCTDGEARLPDAATDASADAAIDGSPADATMANDTGTGFEGSTAEASVDGTTDGAEDALGDVISEEAAPYDAGPGWQGTDASVVVDTLTDGGLPSVQCIQLATGDLIADPARAVLYASVSSSSPQFGNVVVRIDPTNVAVTGTVFVGSKPNALGISDDGASLYVGDDGSATVCRIDLASGGIYDSVYLGVASFGGERLAREIRTVPGSATQWVVSRHVLGTSPSFSGLALYDGTTLLGEWSLFAGLADSVAFTSPTILYGYNNESTGFDLYELSVGSSGFTSLGDTQGLIQGFGVTITSQGGWIFATSGQAVNGMTAQPAGKYPATGPVWPDPSGTDVWYLQADVNTPTPTLFDFDRSTLVVKRSFAIPAEAFTAGSPTSLVGWSGQTLAFGTPASLCIVTVP